MPNVAPDDLYRLKLAGIKQRDRDRHRVEVEHAGRIKRIADSCARRLVDRRHGAAMPELAEGAIAFRGFGEVEIGLGADEIADGDGDRGAD